MNQSLESQRNCFLEYLTEDIECNDRKEIVKIVIYSSRVC